MLNAVLDKLTNKFHIVLGCCAQAALITYQFKTGKDIQPGLMNTMYAFYAFLLGHAATYQKWPDQDLNAPPTALYPPK